MSNEQTVREAIRGANAEIDLKKSASTLITLYLGIDPDMSVSELKRRLRIAQRALSCHQSGRQIDVGWKCYDRADDLWLWLTREDDQ